jgi:hypothetical protein
LSVEVAAVWNNGEMLLANLISTFFVAATAAAATKTSPQATAVHVEAASAASSSATASTVSAIPPAAQVTIKSVSTSGSGCPAGSVSISISTDRTTVTLGFDDFDTYIGPGANTSDNNKSCDIHLSVRFPSGYTFGVLDATYHGYAQLDSGVTGNLSSSYQFVDGSSFTALAGVASPSTATTLQGGASWRSGGEYTQDATIPDAKVVRSPCGKTVDLIVHTSVSLTSTNSSALGELTDDDATFSFTQVVSLGWTKC